MKKKIKRKKMSKPRSGRIFYAEVVSHCIVVADDHGKTLDQSILSLTLECDYDVTKDWPMPGDKVQIRQDP